MNRLGFNGSQEVKYHPWLKSYPWAKLARKEVKAPFTPDVFGLFIILVQPNEDNFDKRQILDEDEDNAQLINQNTMLLKEQ